MAKTRFVGLEVPHNPLAGMVRWSSRKGRKLSPVGLVCPGSITSPACDEGLIRTRSFRAGSAFGTVPCKPVLSVAWKSSFEQPK
jgi:hypothetical protein